MTDLRASRDLSAPCPRVTVAKYRTDFGRHLAELRRAAGLRQLDVAVEIGVESSTYRKWEYGLNQPHDVAVFARLAAVLGLTMDELWSRCQA